MVGVYFANETVRDKDINGQAARICDKLRSVVPSAILVQLRNEALGDESDSALQLCIHDPKKEAWRIADQTVRRCRRGTRSGGRGVRVCVGEEGIDSRPRYIHAPPRVFCSHLCALCAPTQSLIHQMLAELNCP